MSAIVAGEHCKACGKEYYLSVGNPKWYTDVVDKGLPKSEGYVAFEMLRASGMCIGCYAETIEEPEEWGDTECEY